MPQALFEPKVHIEQVPGGAYHSSVWNDLRECACPALCRRTHPTRRKEFETEAIQLVAAQCASQDSLTLNLVCTGALFGETVLLCHILSLLQEHKWRGTLQVFLIDTAYTLGESRCVQLECEEVVKKLNKNQKPDEPMLTEDEILLALGIGAAAVVTAKLVTSEDGDQKTWGKRLAVVTILGALLLGFKMAARHNHSKNECDTCAGAVSALEKEEYIKSFLTMEHVLGHFLDTNIALYLQPKARGCADIVLGCDLDGIDPEKFFSLGKKGVFLAHNPDGGKPQITTLKENGLASKRECLK